MTTAIYVRISQDQGDTRLGVKRQLADCETLCRKHKWAPIVVYEDNDTSAYTNKNRRKKRPAYTQMMQAVADGDVRRIVAWHPDRLHRSPRELEDFIDAVETAGCDVSTVMAGDYDLTTAAGRMTARIVGAVARGESEHKSDRVSRKMLELAEKGSVPGGIRRFGYHRTRNLITGEATMTVDPDEADEIRRMMTAFLAGQSARAIAADLRARGVPTVAKGQWRSNTVLGILTSGHIAGLREHRGEIIAKGVWPAIVTEADVRNAKTVAAFNSTRTSRDRGSHLLTGLCRCGRCGERMHAGASKGKPVVRCSPPPNGCGRVSMLRGPLEALVADAIFDVTDRARIPSTKAADRLVARTAKDAELKLAELAAAYADNVITIAQLREASERIRGRADEAQTVAASASLTDAVIRPYVAKPGALRAAWPRLALAQRQAVARTLIEQVVIAPGAIGRKTFDPDRVRIDWR